MLLGKFDDGTIKEVEIDLKNPNLEEFKGLTEVYKVGRIYKIKLSLMSEVKERTEKKERAPGARRPGRPKKVKELVA